MRSDPAVTAPVLHREIGASWWALATPPALCATGVLVEAMLGGRVHLLGWAAALALLLPFAVLNVRARRRFRSVDVTPDAARFGPETLPLTDVADVIDGDPPPGARVIGGGLTAPRGTAEVGLRLVDGTTVVGFAQQPDALRDALRTALGERA